MQQIIEDVVEVSDSSTRFKILVVEDDPVISADIKMKLIKMGYEIAGVVRYGEKVEHSVVENKPDMVLMDISLVD